MNGAFTGFERFAGMNILTASCYNLRRGPLARRVLRLATEG
jgi:hypothetical protein